MVDRQSEWPLLAHARFEGEALTLEFADRDPVPCVVKPAVMRALALAALSKVPQTVQDEVIEKVRERRKTRELPVLAYEVHAYAGPTDEYPDAVYEVFARSDDEAQHLVKREKTAAHYQKLVFKKGHVGVIRFTPVAQPRAVPRRDAS